MKEWSRKELKERAKAGIRGYYWAAVIVSFFLAFLGIGVSTAGSNSEEADMLQDSLGVGSGALGQPDLEHIFENLDMSLVIALGLAFLGTVLVLMLISFVVNVLIVNVIEVGACRFYLLGQDGQMVSAGELLWGFRSGNYWNLVKIMLVRDVKVVLWALLLVIPGIVKSFEYRMIPYLLAEEPSMSSGEVFAASRQMMTGNKWKAFVLDLSFLGWEIGADIVGNILRLVPLLGKLLAKLPKLLVAPYIDATGAELYKVLKN